MRPRWLESPRQSVLERPHRARWTHVLSIAGPTPAARQPDNVLLASVRADDNRNQNPARTNQTAKRLARRLDETMYHDPIVAFTCYVMLESVRPMHCDIGEPERLDSRRCFQSQRLKPFERNDRVRKLSEQRGAIACPGSDFADAVGRLKVESGDHCSDDGRRRR